MNKRKVFFKRLKVQISSFYLLTSILLVLIISSVYYYTTSSIILDDALESTRYAVEKSSEDLETYLSKMKNTAEYLSKNQQIVAYLEGGEQGPAMGIVDQALATEPSLASIVIVSKSGALLSNETEIGQTLSENMMHEQWYVNAINNQQMPALTSARLQAFTMDKDSWVIALSQEIVDDDQENLGVMLLDLKYEVIEGYLDHLPLGNEGFAFVMDENAQLVYHPDPVYFTSESKKQDLIQMVSDKKGYDQTEEILTYHVQIPNTHWTLVGVASLDRLVLVRRQIIEVLLTISVAVIVIMLIGSYLLAERMTKPISKLEAAMTAMKKLKDKNSGTYEVETLTEQYHQMLDRIQELLGEIKENERYLRQYELNALYSQINPHFLYNTLDTIVWMAEFDDSEKVIEVTKSLAQFFRVSLSKGQDMITLESEIDHITQYLFIQKQRYDDHLNYNIILPETLKHVMVPKIILQPIVENAIYHGIKEKTEGGHIEVTCDIVEASLIISVKDDGVGFSKTNNKQVKLGGVGLENVKKRLTLLYGEQGQVTIDSAENKGTVVTLKLPYHSEE